jgi:fluoroacetyl-CoA thioesterase
LFVPKYFFVYTLKMKNIFKKGDTKTFVYKVTKADTATFESGTVHEVYATFALGRDAEWCTRLFVLEMKDEDEEGIGTFINIQHLTPASIGSEVIFTGTYEELNGNQLICNFEAKIGDRIIAKGSTGQKILKKEKLQLLFGRIQ